MRIRPILYSMVVVASLLLSSCNHKELCYHHPHTAKVRIDVDWSQFEKETPTGMTVMIYPHDGGEYVRHLTNTTTHAVVDLEAGLYNTVVYNQSEQEFGTVAFTGMDCFSTAEVHTVSATSRWYACRAEEEKLVMQPEWIGTDYRMDVEVTPAMVEAAGEEYMAAISQMSKTRSSYVIATHTPQNIIHTISVKVHLKGIYNLRSARASLTGLAGGYSFSGGVPTGNNVTQLLESWTMTQDSDDPTQGYITAQITSMGLPRNHSAQAGENEFVLSVLLVDNVTVVDIPFEVGDKLQKVYDESGRYTHNLYLELWTGESLPDVKPEEGGGGGFNATVDDWGEEQNVDFEM